LNPGSEGRARGGASAREATTTTKPGPVKSEPDESGLERNEREHAEARGALRSAWSACYGQRAAGPAPPEQLDQVARLATWLVGCRRERHPERSLEELAQKLVGNFFEARPPRGRWRVPKVAWLAEAPDRYLDDAGGGPSTRSTFEPGDAEGFEEDKRRIEAMKRRAHG
jgi:hypothetical protein